MARKSGKAKNGGNGGGREIATDYRHASAKRKNNPPATMAAEGTVPTVPKAQYSYSPRLPPVLRFDPNGKPDALPELLAKATKAPLSKDEAAMLATALRKNEPWLEWAGKREANGFEVDPVALHIHERVSAQAILKVAARQDVDRSLFADPEQEYREAIRFYQHDIQWTNRLILGDSLTVMSSLAHREDLAGKVQMIYIDPPYGIRFGSNFQPIIGRRTVEDKEQDLTREPEMVKAYRDTWQLGIHSYLSYLRNRLLAAKELLADSGSIFVQIGDENAHRVRSLLDEVFDPPNHVSTIAYKTAIGMGGDLLDGVHDNIIWFARDKEKIKYRQLQLPLEVGGEGATRYKQVESTLCGEQRLMTDEEREKPELVPPHWRAYRDQGLTSRSGSATTMFPISFQGTVYRPPSGGWRTSETGMQRVQGADRILETGKTISYKKFFVDSETLRLPNLWPDTGGGITSRSDPKVYIVQTTNTVIQRCMLMTTDPGDLVLDPTCGSGTTAYVAEQWGRRWITIDTSRVAISIARQRLLTAKFDYYELKPATTQTVGGEQLKLNGGRAAGLLPTNDAESPARGFVYKTLPYVTLRSIARNTNLDPIFAKHEPILEAALVAANKALAKVDEKTRAKLEQKLLLKQSKEGKKSITDADRRRWLLPPINRERSADAKKRATVDLDAKHWYAWEVPFDVDADWPRELQDAVTAYRKAWRAKMDEVNACIAANAEQEELVDQPEIERGKVRVSGPFTVEAVQPPEMTLGEKMEPQGGEGAAAFGGEPNPLDTFQVRPVEVGDSPQNIEAYLDQMLRLLRTDGVRFPNNKQLRFSRLEALSGNSFGLHAEGRWTNEGESDFKPDGPANVAVSFGPQYGPVTAKQVVDVIRATFKRGYEALVFAGFSFDAAAQAEIEENTNPKLRVHMAHIAPDVNPGMSGLLKDRPGSQLFTVFGQPRTTLDGPDKDGQYTVTMDGVDIYNPVDNSISETGAAKVAAWFIDGDYDGRTFCITQAFFPDRSAWEKLSRALNGPGGVIDAERFEALSGTKSLPFPAGKYKRVAVKVIDPRGNEVMKVHKL